MDFFYRQHADLRPGAKDGASVDTLTEAGLALYFNIRRNDEPSLTNNTELIIDFDLKAGPKFSEEMREKLKEKLSIVFSKNERKSYIIHRDGHTVSLIRENNSFLLLDPYNTYGVKDADHLPLLKIIRECQPESKIYTLHDKMQNDYFTCRIFALENTIEIERFCQSNKLNLMDVIGSNNNIYFTEVDKIKEEAYKELDINSIPIPVSIIHHTQSMSMVKKISNEFELLKRTKRENETYWEKLYENLESVGGKYINHSISNISKIIETRISDHLGVLKNVKTRLGNNETIQRTFVEFLELKKKITELELFKTKR